MLRKALLLSTLALAACSDDPAAPSGDVGVADSAQSEAAADARAADAVTADAVTADAAALPDSTTADSTTTDSTTTDSTTTDSGAAGDGAFDAPITWDTAGACHAFGFGAPSATIALVPSLPTMTGGSIPLGIFDAVGAKTTGSTGVGGTYQATWSFVTATRLEAVEQLALSGTPPVPVPRALSWSTSGATLTRAQTCGGSSSFSNDYTVRSEAGATYLDVRSGSLMFTFKKR